MSGDIIDALRQAAAAGSGHIVRYLPSTGQEESPAQLLSYTELLEQAEYNAARLYEMPIVGDALRSASSSEAQPVFLVHFEDRLDTMIWFWAVLIAGAVPAITSPSMFSPDRSDRQNHLRHLGNTLKRPLCLTRRSLVAPFEEQDDENAILTFPIDGISAADGSMPHAKRVDSAHEDEDTFPHDGMPSRVAAMMLTSGSTGSAKVVPLTHRQILAALRGKAQVADLRHPKSPFLSWVNMDHVANLVHCHIFAIVSGVSQVQVPAADVLADPLRLLNLLSRHRVSRAFAPNFILARLRRLLDAGQTAGLDADLNLAALYLDTGGEANVVEVCVGLQALLREHGAPEDVIVPSFGMTETCAGCIFNSHCPSYDQSKNLDFASLGTCMPGLRMRVSKIGGDSNDVKPGERGSLELAGEAVFAGYFNNPAATADAFTDDGWFRTGDLAFLDEQDKLHLDGRLTDVININGVKYLPFELESALERADIPGATSTYFCCFSTREVGADTESVHVLYLPSFEESDDAARYQTQEHIMRVTSMHIRCHVQVLPLRAQDLPKSTLGKLSRTKLKDDLQRGHFAAQHNVNQTGIDRHRQTLATDPTSDDEAAVLAIIRQQLRVPDELDFTVHDSILSKGATSMDLVAIMHDINKKLQLLRPLMLIDLLRDPTARGVAARTRQDISAREYDPIVNLQPHGNQTPLWLVHPGVGEVLVFVTLAHRITDRPVHAFRIRGFNAGETTFGSLLEMWQTYHDAIKQRQPRGPYAIAGYSFGGMVAFEVAKLLEAGGDEVRFCGSWNLPPHIKTRMRELIWEECLIHLFYFVGLMEEATAYTHKPVISAFEREGRRLEAIQYLRPYCDSTRWDELGLSEGYYLHWVEIASSTQAMAIDYEPTGTVRCMDVFVADPLSHVAKDREHWRTTRLAAWKSFVREDVRFHDVQGAHFTMLNSEHVPSFAETLRKALRARGV